MHCTNNAEHLYQEEDELRLLAGAKAGRSEEFQRLFMQYWPLIRRLWQKYYVADLELDDWRQEARLVMLRVLATYQGQSLVQFSGFYKQSLTNRILDLYRARQARKRIPADQLASLGNEETDTIIDLHRNRPDDIVYCQKCLEAFMKNCSDFERQVVAHLHRGDSIQQLAEAFHCNERKIRSALTRSRRKLIEELQRGD